MSLQACCIWGILKYTPSFFNRIQVYFNLYFFLFTRKCPPLNVLIWSKPIHSEEPAGNLQLRSSFGTSESHTTTKVAALCGPYMWKQSQQTEKKWNIELIQRWTGNDRNLIPNHNMVAQQKRWLQLCGWLWSEVQVSKSPDQMSVFYYTKEHFHYKVNSSQNYCSHCH